MNNKEFAVAIATEDIGRASSSSALRLFSAFFAVIAALILAFAVEVIARGSAWDAAEMFVRSDRPGSATVAFILLLMLLIDGLLGSRYKSLLVLIPLLLPLAWASRQKMYYIGDPLYPTDFLFYRQLLDLLPVLARERPIASFAIAVVSVLGFAVIVTAWMGWHRIGRRLTAFDRAIRLGIAVPALAYVATIIDGGLPNWTRKELKIVPTVWDQPANYSSNGFLLAFATNAPMAKVFEPSGYGARAIDRIASEFEFAVASPEAKPDVIVIMSESFWDVARLPGVAIVPDPIPTTRSMQSGHVFSPEFGGATANVEFEALTGFSNAMLPSGSLPYQQYIRDPLPSLASMFRQEGYATTAVHPYASWFWNRTAVYEALGFDRFLSAETMPDAPKRGPFVSDETMVDEIISAVESASRPSFVFGVSMQGHGPYEANRYPAPDHGVIAPGLTGGSQASLVTYAQGAAEADQAFKRLMRWAKQRTRPTVIAMFGDHLPPLGQVYSETGYLGREIVFDRETPLVIWSSRGGRVKDIGTISPIFLPLHLLTAAEFRHPYYTGFLASLHERYRVIDRNVLFTQDGQSVSGWARNEPIDPALSDYRLLQYDIMFGQRAGRGRLFPANRLPRDDRKIVG